MMDLLANPNALAVFAVVSILCLLASWGVWEYRRSNRDFRDDARLFDLRHELRTEVEIRKGLAGRLGDLEDRVARLEDPYGKRKRGGAIYDEVFQGVPGLKALENYAPPAVSVRGSDRTALPYVFGVDPPAPGGDWSVNYVIGDDGELRKDNSHD